MCVKDAKRVVDDLRHAVDLLKTGKFKEVKDGVGKIGHAIQVLPDAINECKSGSDEAK